MQQKNFILLKKNFFLAIKDIKALKYYAKNEQEYNTINIVFSHKESVKKSLILKLVKKQKDFGASRKKEWK